VDALISDLKHELSTSRDSPAEKPDAKAHDSLRLSRFDLQILADLIAERVYARIEKRVTLMKTVWLTAVELASSAKNSDDPIIRLEEHPSRRGSAEQLFWVAELQHTLFTAKQALAAAIQSRPQHTMAGQQLDLRISRAKNMLDVGRGGTAY
jgi:hypothetical protein